MPQVPNPSGKRRPKRRHPGEGTVVRRTDRWRAKPWAAVVPYLDAAGRRHTMWLSAGSRDEAEQLRRDEVKRLRSVVPGHGSVGDYVSSWLDTVEVGPGTWPRYRQHLTERILPSFGSVPLGELDPQTVRRALMDWAGSPATRGGTLRLLRAAMKQAVADRRIEHDPTGGIPYPRIPRHEPVTLDAEQARHLMATVKGERFSPILVLSLGLGLRRGEALGLRTQDVVWSDDGDPTIRGSRGIPAEVASDGRADRDETQRGVGHGRGVHPLAFAPRRPLELRIAKSLRYIAPSLRAEGEGPYRLTGTKTGESRSVPLPEFVAEALAARLEERDAERRAAKVWAPNDFVFCDAVGNPIPKTTLDNWWKRMLKRAGLSDMRLHDLRATAITLLLDYGMDLITISRIVGHKDLTTTRRYVGKTPGAMAAAARTMDEVMG